MSTLYEKNGLAEWQGIKRLVTVFCYEQDSWNYIAVLDDSWILKTNDNLQQTILDIRTLDVAESIFIDDKIESLDDLKYFVDNMHIPA